MNFEGCEVSHTNKLWSSDSRTNCKRLYDKEAWHELHKKIIQSRRF